VSQLLEAKGGEKVVQLGNTPYLCRRKQVTTPVTARQRTESLKIKNYRIMTQKNEMSARALAMEELENVNGGNILIRQKFPKDERFGYRKK